MNITAVGFGQAGGKIVDKFLEYEQSVKGPSVISNAVAVNSAKADLMGIDNIPDDRKLLIGQAKVKGHGVGADNELGAEIAEEDLHEIRGMIDKGSTTETDAFVIVAGLGGGTGSGGAPVLANELSHLYTEPVYGVGILPAEDEGGIYNLNAAQSFQNLVESADNTILFDNDSWASAGDSLGDGYEMMNEELVKRLYLLFSAGEVSKTSEVGESVVDASEIINTLSAGGISTIGFSETEIPQEELPSKQGLLSRFKGDSKESLEDSSKNVNRITSLIRKAALGRLTHPIELQGIEKALVVVAGPPKLLNRKGVEKSRQWIENETETMEVRGGDYPIEGNTKMAGIVLLSGVTESDRIRELQRIGVEAKKRTKQIQENSEESLQDLLQTEENLGELTDE